MPEPFCLPCLYPRGPTTGHLIQHNSIVMLPDLSVAKSRLDDPMTANAELREWLDFNIAILNQAAIVTTRLLDDAETFSSAAGPHIRHIMEHVEAFIRGVATGGVHYDQRPHDRAPETDPRLALQRLNRLTDVLQTAEWPDADMLLQLSFVTGINGQGRGSCRSTLGRELHFLASHGIHHFAVLSKDLDKHGVAMPMHFGIAPETVRHQADRIASHSVASAPSRRSDITTRR